MNSLLQYGYISKLLTFNVDAKSLLKTFRKTFRFEGTFNEVLKEHRQ